MTDLACPNDWPHAPCHRLGESGIYFITAGTYRKQHFFKDAYRLDVLQRGLLAVCCEYNWQLEAWCLFSNHYHFVAHSPKPNAGTLASMLRKLHGKMAIWVNKLDAMPGRRIWHNFWETGLSYEKSYLARLHYTHANAVHHGLVSTASHYKWCSATWFENNATAAQVRTVYSMPIDSVAVKDDYDVMPEWARCDQGDCGKAPAN
jgi:putative transposase